MTTKSTAASKTATLHEKLVIVASEVRTVNRGKTNDSQGYRFAAAFDVQQEVLPKLLEQGILFYPEYRRLFDVEEYKTKSGVSQFLVLHESKWVATDGKDRVEVMVIGSGTDMGDKGAYKGMTGDMKYAIAQLLGIAFVDDDPENEREDEKKIGDAEIGEIKTLGDAAGLTGGPTGTLAELVKRETGKSKPGLLTYQEFEKVRDVLKVLGTSGGTLEK